MQQSVFKRLRSNAFLRNVGTLSAGSALGHLSTVAVSPLLTRLYGPREIGELGLYTSYFAVAGVAVALQYESSVVSADTELEASYLTASAALLAVPSSILAGLLLWVLIHFAVLGFEELPWYSPVYLTCTMLFFGVFSALRFWHLRSEHFVAVSRSTALQSSARAMLQVLTGWLGLRSSGLIVSETLGRGVGMHRLLRSAWPMFRGLTADFRWPLCRLTLIKYRRFPLLSFPSSLMDALCVSLTLPLLIRGYGAEMGGYYSLVWRVLALPSVLFTLAVGDTFHSQIAACKRDTPDQVGVLFFRTTIFLFAVGMVPGMILFLFAPVIFPAVFGRVWAASGTIAALIAPWFLSQFVVTPVSRVVLVLGGQESKLIWDCLCLASIPAVFYVAKMRSYDGFHTIRVLSIMSTLLYGIYFATLLSIVSRHRRQLKDALPALATEGGLVE